MNQFINNNQHHANEASTRAMNHGSSHEAVIADIGLDQVFYAKIQK